MQWGWDDLLEKSIQTLRKWPVRRIAQLPGGLENFDQSEDSAGLRVGVGMGVIAVLNDRQLHETSIKPELRRSLRY